MKASLLLGTYIGSVVELASKRAKQKRSPAAAATH